MVAGDGIDALLGTPWYTKAAQFIGYNIHSESIMFVPLAQEFHLIIFNKIWIDWNAKLVAHWFKDGQYNLSSVVTKDGAWLQANTRVLAAKIVEENVRILPGATSLPNEQFLKGQIWGGIPATPVGTVLQPNVRERCQTNPLEDFSSSL